eukprot:TRINITY_DN5025_c0_g1_i5.p1 TRINITY_DN5025_c0_g1~~TRINITY_DN5025_c0_g1_i5.p1  ORF type:complete len:462 (-),score=58.29 TRINITY_DN5025_c0_g1_i5:24-1409(-)
MCIRDRWNMKLKNMVYKNNMAPKAYRYAAGLRAGQLEGNCYWNPLVECSEEGKGPAPSAQLLSTIFPAWEYEITQWQRGVVRSPLYQHPCDVRCFLESMHEFRTVVLHAAVMLRRYEPDHDMLKETAFKSLEFLDWSKQVLGYIDTATPPRDLASMNADTQGAFNAQQLQCEQFERRLNEREAQAANLATERHQETMRLQKLQGDRQEQLQTLILKNLGIPVPPPPLDPGAAAEDPEMALNSGAPTAATLTTNPKAIASEHAVRLSGAMRTIVNSITNLVTVWEGEVLPFQVEHPDRRWWREIPGDSTMYSRMNKLYTYLKALWEMKAQQSHGHCTTAAAKLEQTRLLQVLCTSAGGIGNLEKDLTTATQLVKDQAQQRGEDASGVLVRLVDVSNATDLRKIHSKSGPPSVPALKKKRKSGDRKGVTNPGMNPPTELFTLHASHFSVGEFVPVLNNPNAGF